MSASIPRSTTWTNCGSIWGWSRLERSGVRGRLAGSGVRRAPSGACIAVDPAWPLRGVLAERASWRRQHFVEALVTLFDAELHSTCNGGIACFDGWVHLVS